MFPVKCVSGVYTNNSIKTAIGLFFVGNEVGHLWFLVALFWVMIIFVMMQKIIEKYGGNNQMLLLICSWLIQMSASRILVSNFAFARGMMYILWFAIGWIFEKYLRNKLNFKKALLIFGVASIFDFINNRYVFWQAETVMIIGIAWTISVSYILSIVFKNLYKGKIYNLILRNALNIYLFHDPLEYVVLKLTFTYKWLESEVGCWAYLFGRTIVVIIISILIGELCRKVLGLAKRIRRGKCCLS